MLGPGSFSIPSPGSSQDVSPLQSALYPLNFASLFPASDISQPFAICSLGFLGAFSSAFSWFLSLPSRVPLSSLFPWPGLFCWPRSIWPVPDASGCLLPHICDKKTKTFSSAIHRKLPVLIFIQQSVEIGLRVLGPFLRLEIIAMVSSHHALQGRGQPCMDTKEESTHC